MHVEEILLSATEDEFDTDQPSEQPEPTATLEQISCMRRCRAEFTLFSNRRLSIKTQGLMKKVRDYSIDIGILDPQVKRSFKIRWRILLMFAGFCGAAYYVAVGGHSEKSMLLTVTLGLCAVLSLVTAMYRSHDRLVYYSRYGRVPLVVLFNRSPDPATLDSFTAALSQQAENAKSDYLGENHSLNEELKGLRQLMEEGVISGRRYDLAKQRILSRHCHGRR